MTRITGSAGRLLVQRIEALQARRLRWPLNLNDARELSELYEMEYAVLGT